MSKRDVITVDGLGASGKSALAKALARRLGYGHLNSGLVYRAMAFLALRDGVDPGNGEEVLKLLDRHQIGLNLNSEGSSIVLIDGREYDSELHSIVLSRGASLVSRHQILRDRLLSLQREAFVPLGIVAEGRDMGTVVFPDARVKFFVHAELRVRAERRYLQLKGTEREASLEEIEREIAERDERDASSPVGTMRKADGAVEIDNSMLKLEDIVKLMEEVVGGKAVGLA
jgi:cytidylate kinase